MRRRTNFDFDIWADDEDKNSNKKGQLPSKEWVDKEALIHTAKGKSKHMPKAAAKRDFSTGSLLPAVEVPHAGSSYNPSVEEHQDLLWKATMVELAKEKEIARVERQTTAMFPSKGKAPTAQDRVKEMSEGILELNQDEGDDDDEDEGKADADAGESSETEDGEGDQKVVKPKTRKQKRDRRGRMFEEQREKRLKEAKIREMEVMRVKSLKKELSKEDQRTQENQERREKQRGEKMSGPIQLSNYKYEPQELELKLSDELTGNLRNLSPEGSLLEDRFKSMQRRKIEKRGHRMGWEENKNVVAKKIRQEAKMRR